jgi:NADP-dependent 3-hydroxy acid dehydrogenase YdfG
MQLAGKVAWVTGAGSGIGEAAALRLAEAGAAVVLTGRRREPLEATAAAIVAKGGAATVAPADVQNAVEVRAVAATLARCDILVNNAGLNVPNRTWEQMTTEGTDTVLGVNLNGAFYTSLAVLPIMRAQKDGLLIHTASWAGRFVSKLAGAAYSVAKHGVVAMSESINREEFGHGIRSCCICPGEVATPILDKRPVPVTAEQRARMLQSEDLANAILYVATQPPHVCINEILLSPTHNRSFSW